MNIYNVDCVEFMKTIWLDKFKGKVDLVIADPPYNISRDNNFDTLGNRQWMNFGWWDIWFNQVEWIRHLRPLLKENANVIIFNDYKNFWDIIWVCNENNISIKRCLVLNKSNPAPFNRDRLFVNDVEFALWWVYNSKGKPAKWIFNRKNPIEKCVIDTKVQSSKLHPTMKDIKVIKHLIELLSNEGDLVFDPFMWSWTTALACEELNRNWVGCEIDEKYIGVINERLSWFRNIKDKTLFC